MSTRANVRLISFCLFLILAMLTLSATLIYSAGFQDLQSYMTIEFEADKVTLNFGNNTGSNINSSTCKVVYNSDKSKFKITGITPTISNGSVTNLSALTNSSGAEFYYFATNSSVLNTTSYTDPGTTDYISGLGTSANPARESWYDVPSNKMTIYATFMVPTDTSVSKEVGDLTGNVIFGHNITYLPYQTYSNSPNGYPIQINELEIVVLPNSLCEVCHSSSSVLNKANRKDDVNTARPGGGSVSGSIFYSSSVTKIEISNSVYYFDAYVFGFCEKITNITIPNSVKAIENYAFFGCSKLTRVIFADTSKTWTVVSNTISVTDPTQNATYLTNTYNDYPWTKNS